MAPQVSTSVDLRLAVYSRIVRTGRVPTIADLSADLHLSPADVAAGLRHLQAIHALALAPASDEILMAHPFSAMPTPYAVRTTDRVYWANCAWDAVSIPAMLGVDASLDARCADCGEPLTVTFARGALQPDAAVIHFAVPPRRFWDNIGYT